MFKFYHPDYDQYLQKLVLQRLVTNMIDKFIHGKDIKNSVPHLVSQLAQEGHGEVKSEVAYVWRTLYDEVEYIINETPCYEYSAMYLDIPLELFKQYVQAYKKYVNRIQQVHGLPPRYE